MFDSVFNTLSPFALAALAGIAFVAAMARGFSGFGGALIFIPVASALIGPRTAVPLMVIIDGVLTLGLIPNAWRLADKREVGTMSLGALAGVPLGAWLLISLDPLVIRWAVAGLAAVMLALLLSGWRYAGKPTAITTIGVGGLSGIFSGVAQVGGPPVVAYWLGGAIPAAMVRANMVLFFAIMTVFTATSYLAGGLFTKVVFAFALVAGPAYGLGLIVGARLFGLASETTFRRICCALIAVAVLFGLPVFGGR
ncbi:MAG TPA: sulfite exporter TauE/SafE family protein [Terriglobia bacterium]|nr:sulfite exporter TauE/SafE family protein [Terriglobia bacterium]